MTLKRYFYVAFLVFYHFTSAVMSWQLNIWNPVSKAEMYRNANGFLYPGITILKVKDLKHSYWQGWKPKDCGKCSNEGPRG